MSMYYKIPYKRKLAIQNKVFLYIFTIITEPYGGMEHPLIRKTFDIYNFFSKPISISIIKLYFYDTLAYILLNKKKTDPFVIYITIIIRFECTHVKKKTKITILSSCIPSVL